MSVKIREDGSGEPGELVATLTNPMTLTADVLNTFTAPSGTTLDASTTYWISVNEGIASGRVRVSRTSGTDETGAMGWSIGDASLFRTSDSASWSTQTSSLIIVVNGTAYVNSPATGAPAISGTPALGRTVSAGMSDIADAEGLPATFPDDYNLQWVRVDAMTMAETDIDGATSAGYRLVTADLGKKVKVRVSFTDAVGYDETLTSAAWPSGTGVVTIDDITAPVVSTATVRAYALVLTYDEALDTGSVPASGAYSVRVDGGRGTAPSNVAVNGREATLTLGTAVDVGQSVTVSYTPPTTHPLRDASGNAAAALSNASVTNLTAGSTDARLSGLALVSGTMDIALVDASDDNPTTFSSATTTYLAWVANGVSSVTVTATKRHSGATVSIAGDATPGTPGTATLALSVGASTIAVTVTAQERAVTETYTVTVAREAGAPAADADALLTANMTVGDSRSGWFGYFIYSGRRGALSSTSFTYEGDDVELDLLRFAAANLARLCLSEDIGTGWDGLIVDAGTWSSRVADWTVPGPEGHKNQKCRDTPTPALRWRYGDILLVKLRQSDSTAPLLERATVERTALVLTYDEALDTGSVPAPGAYSVSVDSGAGTAPSRVAVSGSAVTLTLSTAVTSGQSVTVSYTPPGSNPVQDTMGNDAAALDARAVFDATAPALESATVDGASLVLTYDLALSADEDSTTRRSWYSVSVDGGAGTFPTGVAVSGRTVTLTLGSAVRSGQTVRVSYRWSPSEHPPVRGLTGNAVASLDARRVTNATAPVLESATVDGPALVLAYDASLDTGSVPSPSAYAVSVDGGAATAPSGVAVSGSEVTLTLRSAVRSGQTVRLSYVAPTTDPIEDAAGNDVAALTAHTVTNATAPALESATVDGTTLVLLYDAALDPYSVPSSSAYAVRVNRGAGRAPANVAVRAGTVTLTLAAAVELGQTVTVSYTPPSTDPIRDAAEHDAARLVNAQVSNLTRGAALPAPPAGLTATPVSGARIALSWVAPSREGNTAVEGYRIEWSPDATPPWQVLVADTGDTRTTHTDTGPAHGDTRHYRVTAINSLGTGDPSIVARATADGVAPTLDTAAVVPDGGSVRLRFLGGPLDTGAPVAPGAFTLTADGAPIVPGAVTSDASDSYVLGELSPPIRQDQGVTVAYADPTVRDDPDAMQDAAGNDVASFTLGTGDVTNGSTLAPQAPGKPTEVRAAPTGPTGIELTWRAPADNGGRAITGYRIEISEDVTPLAFTTRRDIAGTATTWSHTGLVPDTIRHYRVSATNALGTGEPSDAPYARATTGEPQGEVALSLDAQRVAEDTEVRWSVTATTLGDALPDAGLPMQVRVVSRAGTATEGVDYTATDTTVTFVRADFARRTVGGERRYVAEKSAAVAVADDAEVEAEEGFALEMSVESGGGGWTSAATRAEVVIENDDTWGVEVSTDTASLVEGETREVTLTARVTPAGQGCVVSFAFDLELAIAGTATRGADYRLDPVPAPVAFEACAQEKTWRTVLSAHVDTADDAGEHIEFTPGLVGDVAFAPARLRAATLVIGEGRGVVLGAVALDVEEGERAGYTVALTARPTGTVTVTPRVDDNAEVTVSGPLTFTRESWNVAQRITVSAAHDEDEAHDTATVTHAVSGADYGAVSAGRVRVTVLDDEQAQSQGDIRSVIYHPWGLPTVHYGQPFEVRADFSSYPGESPVSNPESQVLNAAAMQALLVGPERTIRVRGGTARIRDIFTGSHRDAVYNIWLRVTPDSAAAEVTVTVEPLPCDTPGAFCNSYRGGLADRVRHRVLGVATAPPKPTGLALAPGKDRDGPGCFRATWDDAPQGNKWRAQWRNDGGEWVDDAWRFNFAPGSSAYRQSRGAAEDGFPLSEALCFAGQGLYEYRVRWENPHGAGPWSDALAIDRRVAPPAAVRLVQLADEDAVRLEWSPVAPSAEGVRIAKQQYRLARFPETIGGRGTREGRSFSDDGWRDIPESGADEANARQYLLNGLRDAFELRVQMRTVASNGVESAPSAEARIRDAAPGVAMPYVLPPPAVVSSPGPDGVYSAGETIAVELRMSRPVRLDGTGTPSVGLRIGSRLRRAPLAQIRHSTEHFHYGSGRGDTLRFEYVVAANDADADGFGIPAAGVDDGGARIVDATPERGGTRAELSWAEAAQGGAPVEGTLGLAAVERIEWHGNLVWVYFDADLGPSSRIDGIASQFTPSFSVSSRGEVQAARVVRGRGWSRCGRGEQGCRTVRLTLGQVYRPDPLSTNPWRNEPSADETVRMSYTPHAHLAKYRLRDGRGHEVPAFDRVRAVHLAAGADPVLSVADAHGREGQDRAMHFQVRLAPAASAAVTVDYATSDGTALAGQDYTARSGTLTFAAGETVKTVSVPIVDDALEDSGETLTLTLSSPSGARIGDGAGTGTIYNSEDLVQASFASLPESHDGSTAFAFRLALGEEVPVDAAVLRSSAFALTGGAVTGVRQVDAASRRSWEITVAPSTDGDLTIALEPKQSCDDAGAICAEDGRGLAETVSATVPGPATAPPVVVVSAAVTSDAGANGTWDAGEEVVAALRFSDTVTVTGSGTPALDVLLGGAPRAAAYAGGSGTDTLTFRLAVAAEDAGAGRARLVANGLSLDGATIVDSAGRSVDTGFAVAPWVTEVVLAADGSGDGVWTPDESIEVSLTFSEAVTVAGGTPSLGVTGVTATGEERVRELAYVSGSGTDTLAFAAAMPDAGTLSRLAVIADTLGLHGASLVSAASGLAAETGHDGTAALSAPRIAGVAQVGGTLEASFAEAPGGTVTYRWLRGAEEIAGATASTYAPVAADVGEALSVRVESGGASVTSAPSAPVWPAPVNPPLAAGEEEVLSATLTLGVGGCVKARVFGEQPS